MKIKSELELKKSLIECSRYLIQEKKTTGVKMTDNNLLIELKIRERVS